MDKKLIEIVKKFNISHEIIEIQPYGHGHINATYRITVKDAAERKSYILQKINTYVFKNVKELMENVSKVTEYMSDQLAAEGQDALRGTLHIVSAMDGKSYYTDSLGEVWRVLLFIEDTICYEQADSIEIFRESGHAFGAFARLLSDFPIGQLYDTIPDFHNTPKRLEKLWKTAAADICGRAQDVAEELRFIKERERDCYYFTELYEDGKMPLRVTHNDTKLNNVLFDAATQKGLCVIDLDTVMPGFVAFDFGDAIRFGASTGAEDEPDLNKISCDLELYEAYTKGFLDGAGSCLLPEEIHSFPMGAKVMTLESGIRFLTDYLEGDVYFKIDHKKHNLDRCRTQLKLVQDMEVKWNDIQDIIKKAWS